MHRPPVIGIDASRLAVGERTGTETYTAQLLSHLPPHLAGETVRLYLNSRELPPEAAAPYEAIRIPFPRLWTHARLSWEMARRRPDILFVPAHVVPLVHPPSVVTIHDLGYLHEPESHPQAARRHLHLTTRWSVRAARRVIAISAATRRDLVRAYGVPEAKIRVVHHGVGPEFRLAPREIVAELKARLGLPARYVLAIGTVQPRKNVGRLAHAMRSVRESGLPHHLVVAGKRGWLAETVDREVATSGMADLVHWAGYVAPADLPALYSGADAFCFPSLYEGFGLPALEAMACGVPTIVSDRGALPEVVENAALVVDSTDVRAMGSALIQTLTDPDLRRRLSADGFTRAAHFSWDRTAAHTLTILRDLLPPNASNLHPNRAL